MKWHTVGCKTAPAVGEVGFVVGALASVVSEVVTVKGRSGHCSVLKRVQCVPSGGSMHTVGFEAGTL